MTEDYYFYAIQLMLDAAKEEGLEVEVLLSYTRGIQSGMSIKKAVSYALAEWDI